MLQNEFAIQTRFELLGQTLYSIAQKHLMRPREPLNLYKIRTDFEYLKIFQNELGIKRRIRRRRFVYEFQGILLQFTKVVLLTPKQQKLVKLGPSPGQRRSITTWKRIEFMKIQKYAFGGQII